MKEYFKLKKNLGNFKKGYKFDPYGGLVSGVHIDGEAILFTDKDVFEYVNEDAPEQPGKVTLGVGDGLGQHLVDSEWGETIKLLQAKLLRAEAIEAGLRRAIGVLNSIPNRMVPHEGKKTYVIIPELEELLKYKLEEIEKYTHQKDFEESALRVQKNSLYGKFNAEDEKIVHQVYYDGKSFRACVDYDIRKSPDDYPFFLPEHGARLKWEALAQREGPIPLGFLPVVPPVKVVIKGEFASFQGVINHKEEFDKKVLGKDYVNVKKALE